MKKSKKSDRFIVTITEHKQQSTLVNYDPLPELEERFEAARAINGIKNPQARIETVTSSQITKKVSKTSVTHVSEPVVQHEAGGRKRKADQG